MASPIEFARHYVGQGWQVLPLHSIKDGNLCTCGDTGCRSVAKHPLTKNGLLDASDLEEDIEQWWKEWPWANVGIRTGEESGVWVLDVDAKSGGLETLAKLELEHGRIAAPVVLTGSGGRHYYFAWDSIVEIRSHQGVAPGLDTRGTNGYVVAPPSIHESGNYYRWLE